MGDKRYNVPFYMDFGESNLTGSYEDRARLHEEHRQRVVTTLLAEFHLMAIADILPQSTHVIGQQGAYWQDFSGSSANQTNAAHCVPCQIIISGRKPEQYVRKHSGDRAEVIKAYFGKTDLLPEVFNKCDSRCESMGLVNAFWDACIDALNTGYTGSFTPSRVQMNVEKAFSVYKTKAKMAFDATILHFKGKPGSYAQKGTKIKIVESYKKELRYSTAFSTIVKMGELNDSIKLYKSF